MEFRKTEICDVGDVMVIIDKAKRFFEEQQIPQWNDGYPDGEAILSDIDESCSYVLCGDDGKIVATVAIPLYGEPDYDIIYDGKWLTDGLYGCIHRIAVDSDAKRNGLASQMIENAVRICKDNGFASLRVDTHEINAPMRSMLEKNGFVHCGTIYLSNGEPRVAYELVF